MGTLVALRDRCQYRLAISHREVTVVGDSGVALCGLSGAVKLNKHKYLPDSCALETTTPPVFVFGPEQFH